MKAVIATFLLILFSTQLTAKTRGMSLEEAVNQVKTEGKVLSAKTVNGKHEIKVLTPSGAVKTINKSAAKSQANSKRPEFFNKGGKSYRDRKQNDAVPSRFNNQRRNNRMGSRQLDLQPMTFQNRNKSNKNNQKNNQSSNNKKDK